MPIGSPNIEVTPELTSSPPSAGGVVVDVVDAVVDVVDAVLDVVDAVLVVVVELLVVDRVLVVVLELVVDDCVLLVVEEELVVVVVVVVVGNAVLQASGSNFSEVAFQTKASPLFIPVSSTSRRFVI